MKIQTGTLLAMAAGFLIVCSPVFAHHGSTASYDMHAPVTMTGTVTEFAWRNPHCQIYFDVKDGKGNIVNWAAETGSPGILATKGWSKRTLKPGDQITITVFPSKAGAPVGLLSTVKGADGQELMHLSPEEGIQAEQGK